MQPDSLPALETVSTDSLSPFDIARQRLIVALDFPRADSALELADRLSDALEVRGQWFKVGLELYIAAGPSIVEALVGRGHSVFLDLKLHDIPNTVAGAVKTAGSLGAKLLTLHASGGPAMLTAAREATASLLSPPELLAVTVLTSMDQVQINSVGVERTPQEQVTLLAKMGLAAGIRGFVCSPQEVAALRALTGPDGVLVTPGIRPSGAAVGDQQRIATPAQAIQDGASYLVVGRPITQASDPALAAEAIVFEIAEALGEAPQQ